MCISWWSNWNSKTWNNEIKRESRLLRALLAHLAASLVQPVTSSVLEGISERGVRTASWGYMNKNFEFRSSIEITNYFKYEPRFNGVSSRNNLPRIKDGAYAINLIDRNSIGT